MPKALDLTGQKFGRLTAIESTNKRDKQGLIIWKFKCDCGNIIEKNGRDVKRGTTQSCGCLKRDLLIERNTKNNKEKYFIGQQFGNLTIISNLFFKEQKRGHRESWVKCKCKCGNILDVRINNLGTGMTKSCGCIQSFGEQQIIKLLIDNNINFSTQYTFPDLRGPKDGLLRFDFAIFYNNELYELIEFDGRQHFEGPDGKWSSSYSLKDLQIRDNLKNEYCLKHNIKLIRISYKQLSQLNLKLLNLENIKE